MFNAERLGGAVCLCAMAVPRARFDAVRSRSTPIARSRTTTPASTPSTCGSSWRASARSGSREVAAAIEAETGLTVYSMPKLDEYFIGLKVEV